MERLELELETYLVLHALIFKYISLIETFILVTVPLVFHENLNHYQEFIPARNSSRIHFPYHHQQKTHTHTQAFTSRYILINSVYNNKVDNII